MNKLQIFNNDQFGQIRALEINGAPYFVGNDVATALGYDKPRNAVARYVDKDDALKRGVTDELGRNQETVVISESGMYALVFGSKLPAARAFKHWVTAEVLPTIRKTGGYMSAKDTDTPEMIMARAVLVANDTIARQKQQLEQAQKAGGGTRAESRTDGQGAGH